jgi:HAD superfamily hydrolase (TIGR01509 family)
VTTIAASAPRPASQPSRLQAVLLDMDGTLVDTEDFWWEAESSLLADLGYRLDERERKVVVGGPMDRVVEHLLAVSGVELAPERLGHLINERFTELIAQGVPLRPGAKALLEELTAYQVPTALVSASHRRIIDLVLRSIGPEHFRTTVAGDEVPRTKPHPDPYLQAARRLGAEPARCVVIEDAPTGVASAEAAGCAVLAVPSVAAIQPAPGRAVHTSLTQVSLAVLRALL